jgi:hypothetical protein
MTQTVVKTIQTIAGKTKTMMLVSEFMMRETETIVAKPMTTFRLTWNVFLLIKNAVFLAQTIGPAC